jgi:hypothetical protein
MRLITLALFFVPVESIWVVSLRDSLIQRAALAKQVSKASTALAALRSAFCFFNATPDERAPKEFREVIISNSRALGKSNGPNLVANQLWNQKKY